MDEFKEDHSEVVVRLRDLRSNGRHIKATGMTSDLGNKLQNETADENMPENPFIQDSTRSKDVNRNSHPAVNEIPLLVKDDIKTDSRTSNNENTNVVEELDITHLKVNR